MIRLSVNLNKIATLRNSRHAQPPAGPATGRPDVWRAARVCLEAGVTGITVHPREDRRHITFADVRQLAAGLAPHRSTVEFNIEGDPRPDLLELVESVAPHQFTLVPTRPGELTSEAGWTDDTPTAPLAKLIDGMHARGTRVSVFVDPRPDAVVWAADLGADRVELFTEPFARAFDAGPERAAESFARYVEAAERAHALGLGVNAGHDLDLDNLALFATLPHLDEVSIGHALVSDALFEGLSSALKRYRSLVETAGTDRRSLTPTARR